MSLFIEAAVLRLKLPDRDRLPDRQIFSERGRFESSDRWSSDRIVLVNAVDEDEWRLGLDDLLFKSDGIMEYIARDNC